MANQHDVDGSSAGNWTAGRLVALGVVTLAVAFAIINFIAETGLNRP